MFSDLYGSLTSHRTSAMNDFNVSMKLPLATDSSISTHFSLCLRSKILNLILKKTLVLTGFGGWVTCASLVLGITAQAMPTRPLGDVFKYIL